ncbi:MAG: 1,4-dihydroxy-2-naphthoate polyprenyltransferase [Microbacteriaceae bacterium]
MPTPKQERINPATVSAAARKRRSKKPGGRPPGVAPVRKATARDWIGGARLRTLPLAIAPVALGTATAYVLGDGEWHPVRALLCLAVALGLQIAVNFANDYSDGIRGTDAHRVGPSRLTGSGAAKPRTVLAVALVFFGLAALAGVAVVIASGIYWLLAVGVVSVVAAWFYTGGKRPYGYAGLGEVFVFVFFGLVATVGTTLVQAGTVNLESWIAGIAAGLFACAVLVANNLRDLVQDRAAGKKTLSVRIGDTSSRILFAVLVLTPYALVIFFGLLYINANYAYLTLFIAIPAVIIASTAKTAKEFVLALQLTSLAALAYALVLSLAIIF